MSCHASLTPFTVVIFIAFTCQVIGLRGTVGSNLLQLPSKVIHEFVLFISEEARSLCDLGKFGFRLARPEK